MTDAQEEGIRFAEIVLGVEISDEPAPPGSRLAKLHELDREAEATGMSDEEFARRAAEL